MNDLMRSRVTGQHGAGTSELLGVLLECSRRPERGFDLLEKIVERDPALRRQLLRVANAPRHRGLMPVTRTRQALVRLGLVTASEVLLEASHRVEPTRLQSSPPRAA